MTTDRGPGGRAATRAALAALVAVGVLGGAVAWSAASDDGPAPPEVQPGTVAFLGDSITANAEAELEALGAPLTEKVVTAATSGAMSREQLPEARILAGIDPRVVVINLGTNDAVCVLTNAFTTGGCRYPGFDGQSLRDDLVAVVETFDPAQTCIVGVVPTFAADTAPVWDELVAGGRAAGVVEWGPRSQALGATVLADDLGHLTAKGDEVYADAVWQGIGDICDR